jgi:hypothetical protein
MKFESKFSVETIAQTALDQTSKPVSMPLRSPAYQKTQTGGDWREKEASEIFLVYQWGVGASKVNEGD